MIQKDSNIEKNKCSHKNAQNYKIVPICIQTLGNA